MLYIQIFSVVVLIEDTSTILLLQVGGLASLIASAIALEALLSFPEDGIPSQSNERIVDDFTERDLQFNSQAGAGTGIAVSILLMFLGIVVIVMRFLNFGLVNAKSKIFWSIVSEYNARTCAYIHTFRSYIYIIHTDAHIQY